MPINPPMKSSPAVVPMVEKAEGFSATIYQDEGHPCIGFGCDLLPSEVEHYEAIQPITRQIAEQLLLARLVPVEHVLNQVINVPVNQNQFDSLSDFTYNLGPSRLIASTTLKMLNLGQYQSAADWMLAWDKDRDSKGNLVEDAGLKSRREAERTLFLTPIQT